MEKRAEVCPERGRPLRPPQSDVSSMGRQWRGRGTYERLDPDQTRGMAGCGFNSLLQQLEALGRKWGRTLLKGAPRTVIGGPKWDSGFRPVSLSRVESPFLRVGPELCAPHHLFGNPAFLLRVQFCPLPLLGLALLFSLRRPRMALGAFTELRSL